jgi:hypothetical protein
VSINSLTNAAIARRPHFAPGNRAPDGLSEIAQAAVGMPAATGAGVAAPATGGTTASNGITTALNVLAGYIPTEIVTLYGAYVAAIHPKGTPEPPPSYDPDWTVFFAFLIVTPIVLWLIFAAKVRSAQKPLPLLPKSWPLWEMCAATIAFAAWAFALPATPFREFKDWYNTGLAAVVVLTTSTMLGLVAPLFQNELKP